MSENMELTENELLSLYSDVIEGPEYLAAAKNSCPSQAPIKKSLSVCGAYNYQGLGYSCCTSSIKCFNGQIVSGSCMAVD